MSIQEQLDRMFQPNPFYEKAKVGRPSKAAIEKRQLAHDWDVRNRMPHSLPLVDHLKAAAASSEMTRVDGKIYVQYESPIQFDNEI